MTYAQSRARSFYADIGKYSGVEAATPHRLIQLLMEGGLDRLAKARGHLQRQEVADKGTRIGQAIGIIDGLRVSLDHKDSSPLSGQLEALYDYMSRRLLQANLDNDIHALDEVSHLLGEIKQAWDAIPQSLQQSPQPSLRAVGGV